MSFVSLHNHTDYSNSRFLDSINRPNDMVKKALSLGFSGIAFTDHESVSDAVTVLQCRDLIEKENPDFKIIFGNEIYLIDEAEVKNTNNFYHFILLAKDEIGWLQLKTLSSKAWDRGYVYKGLKRVPTTYQDIENVIGADPGHIIASTACLGGFLPKSILDHKVDEANHFIQWCIKIFGKDNFYLELQPSDSEEQIKVNQVLLKFASHYNIPYIITTDSHYLNKEDFEIHKIYLNSKTASDRETEKFYRFTYMMSEEEMTEILLAGGMTEAQIKDGFYSTCKLADQIKNYDFRHSTIVPRIKIPKFDFDYNCILHTKGMNYEFISNYYNSSDDQDLYLMYQIEEGVKAKNIVLDDERLDRIDKELEILWFISEKLNEKLSSYLNLTKDIVDTAWQVSLCGPGRGSACGEYINYLIGITQVDPLVYGLKHWRFLNKERVELPDVDEDFQPEKVDAIIQLLKEKYGDDNVLQCATFKTESLKSAILSCGRGLGYNSDEMQALSALVPSHRGHTYTLSECLNGDEDKGFDPVPDFKQKLELYPGLFEAVEKIEGLHSNNSRHASALYIFNNGYLEHNSLITTPNGTKTTAFSMHDSDDQSALKMDLLVTDAQTKIAKCMELLLKDGLITWQGNLRATYDKYLHPDVLEYDNPKIWEKAADGSVPQLFQFDTQVGSVCIRKSRPINVMQLAEVNSIMRLQIEGSEQPIDRYVRFRNNIQEWYDEMNSAGLTEHEQKILEKYLLGSNGVSGSQETLMQILMDPEITNFTLGESNAARKAIAKKIAKKIIQLKKDFYEKGASVGSRPEFLDYIFKYCIEPQLGYSFSINHTLPYSVVAVQELQLNVKYNPLYWACACLCVNAGSYVGNLDESAEDDEEYAVCAESAQVEEESEEETKTKKSTTPNYAKIARAISNLQDFGIKIELPDINKAQVDFTPDIENNSILYGLQAINVVNEDLMNAIIFNRPYETTVDFYRRVKPTMGQMTGLIKAGCFDNLYKDRNMSRSDIAENFLKWYVNHTVENKEKITATQIKQIMKLGFKSDKFSKEIRMFKFAQYIGKNRVDMVNKRFVFRSDDDHCLQFIKEMEIIPCLKRDEYGYMPGGMYIKMASFKKFYTTFMLPLTNFFNSQEGIDLYNNEIKNDNVKQLTEKYFVGSFAAWEMETLNCYQSKHELSHIDRASYKIENFNELPEAMDKCKHCAVAGTVIGTDNLKHIVTLLTLDGVVDVKFYGPTYDTYNKKISVVDPTTNKKTVIDDSWFKRGNKIIVYGKRRENMFCCRMLRVDGYSRTVGLITLDRGFNVRYTRSKK